MSVIIIIKRREGKWKGREGKEWGVEVRGEGGEGLEHGIASTKLNTVHLLALEIKYTSCL